MGIRYEDGYSANVEGFLVVDGVQLRLAKSNGRTFVLADSCELSPGTQGQLLVVVDGVSNSRLVELPGGVRRGQTIVKYLVTAPF